MEGGFKAICPDFRGSPVLTFSPHCPLDGEFWRMLSFVDWSKGNCLNSWVWLVPGAQAASSWAMRLEVSPVLVLARSLCTYSQLSSLLVRDGNDLFLQTHCAPGSRMLRSKRGAYLLTSCLGGNYSFPSSLCLLRPCMSISD